MNIYLAKLREKPMPNIKHKEGVHIFVGKKIEELEEEEDDLVIEKPAIEETNLPEEEKEDETKEDEPIKPKNVCQIRDGRKNASIDYNAIKKALMEKGTLLTEKKTLPKQMGEVQEKEEDKPTKDINVILEKEKKKDIEEDEMVEKPVVIKQAKIRNIAMENIDSNMVLDGDSLKTRLPKDEQMTIRSSGYYMNNRKKFISHLMPLFDKYKRELSNKSKEESCDDKSKQSEKGEFNLMIHQRVVRDYLNLYTPYRGLLLYHGLGSGKTCTSIAIAEGMKSQKKIYVLTLASLKANFFDQMKVCGDPLYKLDQYWEFVSVEGKPDYIPILSKILSLDRGFIEKNRGAWMVNVSKESNFQDLNDDDRNALNKQLDEMIRSKYVDLNYNGLNDNIMNFHTKNDKINPFDNSVVIIDEAHNFVSMIVNKIKEKNKKSIPYKLYEYLMAASNARIVLLSGTPIINYPNEIGIMFNILRGYIKTWTFGLKINKSREAFTKNDIVQWLQDGGLNEFDYVDYSGEKLTITRNPFGFVNKQRVERLQKMKGGNTKNNRKKNPRVTKKKKSTAITRIDRGLVIINDPLPDSVLDETKEQRNERIALHDEMYGGSFSSYNGVTLDESGNLSDTKFKQAIVNILSKHNITATAPAKVKSVNNTALPDVSADFLDLFVELDSSEIKNKQVFQRRILGLTSYFKGANDNLYPSFIPSEEDTVYHFERVPMSGYQFSIYEKIRDEESKQEKQNKKKQAKAKQALGAAEDLFNTSSTYKVASRQCCNFAFPDPPGRPKKEKDELIGKEEMDETDENPRKEKLMKGGEDDDEEQSETEEEEEEEDSEKKIKVLDDIVLHDIEDIEKGNPMVEEKENPVVEEKEEKEKEENDDEDDSDDVLTVKNQSNKSKKTKKNKDYQLKVSDVLGELKTRKEEIFTPGGLQIYSPKFLRILNNIKDVENRGSHLVYSQFRTLEGVALFKEVLEANGFAEFRIQKVSGKNDWEMVEKAEDQGKPRYALHTGTESDEEKKIVLNVYNSKWSEVPSSIVSRLQAINQENNFYGDVIKVLMITSSGAEGINLKNTRFVHIMEPYWNMVRPQQVIGRARRICSHQDLPEEMRTVKVFLYMSIIPDEIIKTDKHKNLRLRDVSKLTNKMASNIDNSTMLGRYVRRLNNVPSVVTTDQLLFERALQKDQVNSQILHAVKESSVDCTLYDNKNENLVCYSFGQVRSNAFSTNPTIQKDINDKDIIEVREKTISYREFTYDNKTYVQNKQTLELYNKDDYNEAKAKGMTMYPIGKVVKDKNNKEKVIFY